MMGVSLTSNFRFLLIYTTPFFIVAAAVNQYILIRWPDSDCECVKQLEPLNAFLQGFNLILPIFLSVYLQNETLVKQFTSRNNEQSQQRKIEKILMQQPDGVVILSKVK